MKIKLNRAMRELLFYGPDEPTAATYGNSYGMPASRQIDLYAFSLDKKKGRGFNAYYIWIDASFFY